MSKVAKIILRAKEIDDDDFISVFDIVNNLYWNGQILKNFIIEEEETRFKLIVVLTKEDALEEEYWPEEIKDKKEKFDLDIIIGNDELCYCKDSCICEKSSFYILNPFMNGISSIRCGDCLEEIFLVKLSELNCEDRYEIVNFQELYHSIYALGEYDLEYNKMQLNNVNSKISSLGISICEKIEKKTNIPTYYFLLTDKNVNKCPKCGKELETLPIDITKYSEYCNIDKACKNCHLSFMTNKKEKRNEI